MSIRCAVLREVRTLFADTPIEQLVFVTKMRWRIERDYRELKQKFGLGSMKDEIGEGCIITLPGALLLMPSCCISASRRAVKKRCSTKSACPTRKSPASRQWGERNDTRPIRLPHFAFSPPLLSRFDCIAS